MDTINQYRTYIQEILEQYAQRKYANLDAINEIIVDREHDRYQLVTIGWQRYKRIHATTLHFDIIDGRIWIQNDQTEHGIAYDLLEKGVPKEDIVLGYFHPRRRADTDFAAPVVE